MRTVQGKETEKDSAAGGVFVVMLFLMCFICIGSIIIGIQEGRDDIRREAAREGFAVYITTDEGDPQFQWNHGLLGHDEYVKE